jgi:hypothetical protein
MSEFVESASEPSVVGEIKSKLNDIKDKIKSSGVASGIFDGLISNANFLQTKLDELLKKKGLYNQSDIDDAYATLREAKRKELELMNKKATRRLVVFSILGIGVLVGAYYLIKRNKQ